MRDTTSKAQGTCIHSVNDPSNTDISPLSALSRSGLAPPDCLYLTGTPTQKTSWLLVCDLADTLSETAHETL
ncbi:hypothetical protein PHLCEN_2v12305 [Hermanssonia centrifuga]|uniref:Uncharacterized protein n=1 Tax=Hermanssonia centrifuga TaxID=98765 RepID=A0A2R6NHE7_9APHY|nr:hypothetical protein PHLCEN_2v12305 [Hermanssonia centrifuga]